MSLTNKYKIKRQKNNNHNFNSMDFINRKEKLDR